MKQITKKEFIARHEAGELQLICGMVKKTVKEVEEAIDRVRNNIEQYVIPTSSYGNISTDKNGYQICNIYMSDCENFIFIETLIDNSKSNQCSFNYKEHYVTAYLTC